MDKGKVISQTLVWPIVDEHTHDDTWKQSLESYTSHLTEALHPRMAGVPIEADDDTYILDVETPEYLLYSDKYKTEEWKPEMHMYTHDRYDKLISTRVMVPLGDSKQSAKVLHHKRDGDGNLIGHSSSNPYLDTSLYKVEFSDGHVKAYAANLIAENIYKQLDDKGNKYRLIVEIINHEKDATAFQEQNQQL